MGEILHVHFQVSKLVLAEVIRRGFCMIKKALEVETRFIERGFIAQRLPFYFLIELSEIF